MAFTKTILQRSSSRVTVKVMASAQSDTTPIYLKNTVALTAPGNFTFVKAFQAYQSVSFTGYSSGTTLTVTASNGNLGVGSVLSSPFSAGTVITALGTGSGGAGTYTISISQSVGSVGSPVSSSTIQHGGLIQRASGSWLTDFTNTNFAFGGGTNALGQIVFSVSAGASSGNIKDYSIIGFAQTASANDTILVHPFTPVSVSEGPEALTQTAYYSDVLTPGQTISGTPSVNITNAWASTVTGGGSIMTRNSVAALGLYGGGGDYGSKPPCIPISENNTYDIIVTWQTGSTTGGALVMELAKINGFSSVSPDPVGNN